MGSVFGKGQSFTTGFRYYFGVLAGICRGPVDEIMLIKTDSTYIFDGAPQGAVNIQKYDPEPVALYAEDGAPGDGTYPGGTITGNTVYPMYAPNAYGGESNQGGITGFLWFYFGAKDQLIPAAHWIRQAMAGLLLPAMRGVVTVFFDGEVVANSPYPKAWKYRVRRALKGWDRDGCWYPAKAMIQMTDTGIASYVRGQDGVVRLGISIQGPNQIDDTGASTGNSMVVQYNSTYENTKVTTYTSGGGLVDSVAVPLQYNDIHAMNPAHIIYECCTNRDWGRGMDPALIDHASFAAAADQLYAENFGLCLKWSRTEEIEAFVQTVIDHIGGVVYTDRVSGLLCMRLIRDDYDVSKLSVFDYNSGLLEVTSVSTAAGDTNPNEIIVKYVSPVLDAQKEARQQNNASISHQGCVYSLTRDYSGIPTSDLALRVAARDLRIAGGAWKSVTFRVDRRGYLITPGDCLVLNAPERGLNRTVIRVATVEDTVMTDGKITIVGSQDAYGIPPNALSEQQHSEWLPIDNTPKAITQWMQLEATYWDMIRALGGADSSALADYKDDKYIGFQALIVLKPSSSALNYKIWDSKHYGFSSKIDPFVEVGVGSFARRVVLQQDISITDTRAKIGPGFDIRTTTIPQLMLLRGGRTDMKGRMRNGEGDDSDEFIYVTKLERDATTGQMWMEFSRGCIDTPSVPHQANTYIYDYQQNAAVDTQQFEFNDEVSTVPICTTSRGDFADNNPYAGGNYQHTLGFGARIGKPYPPANFRVNGRARDELAELSGDLVFTWANRLKETQDDKVLSDTDGDVIVTQNTQYHIGVNCRSGPKNGSSVEMVVNAKNTVTIPFASLAGWGACHIEVYIETRQTDLPIFALFAKYQLIYGQYLYKENAGSGPGVYPPVVAPGDNYNFDNDFDNNFDGATAGFGFDFGNNFGGGS